MTRQAGSGLMGLGVVVAAIGAILAFAVTAQAPGFSIHEIGIILLIVGIVTFVIALFLVVAGGSGRRTRSTVREDVRNTPQGHQRVVQEEDLLP
ncbi:MAG: DUF6458 family protein [Acidimicrobiales bacterium]